MRKSTKELHKFIIENVDIHSQDITSFTVEAFGISRQAVNKHLQQLIRDGLIEASGSTRNKKYSLKLLADKTIQLQVDEKLKEDIVWRDKVRPILGDINKNILEICSYGFTEMLNNIIDHSGSDDAAIVIKCSPLSVEIMVADYGEGIFNKIQRECKLEDPREALLELSKGKLTTDPERHSGEGIFFTSKSFDVFSIYSNGLTFSHNQDWDKDWLSGKEEKNKGTYVFMTISLDSSRNLKNVFNSYAAESDDFGFSKTVVPVSLVTYEGEHLVSRSQAKRLVTRFEKFKEVVLDFEGVENIGQAFADEIFRVFTRNHPDVKITPFNTNNAVTKMIKHVTVE